MSKRQFDAGDRDLYDTLHFDASLCGNYDHADKFGSVFFGFA
jgi:hypothetical protein